MIPPLSADVKRYITKFDVAAVVRYSGGGLGASRDPQGAEIAYWIEAAQAGAVLKRARNNGGNIPAAAKALGVHLTDHPVLIQRVNVAIERLGRRLDQAQASGSMAFFNSEFKRRRLTTAGAGDGFMSYKVAKQRLERMLVEKAAAPGEGDPAALIKRVFDDRLPEPQ
jgi:hypothetical protein